MYIIFHIFSRILPKDYKTDKAFVIKIEMKQGSVKTVLIGKWEESREAKGSACKGVEGGISYTVRRMMSGFGDCPLIPSQILLEETVTDIENTVTDIE